MSNKLKQANGCQFWIIQMNNEWQHATLLGKPSLELLHVNNCFLISKVPSSVFSVSRHDIFGKDLRQVLEKRCKLTLRYMNFCVYCNQFFGQCLYETYQSLRWNYCIIKCSYKQTWILLRWFAEVVEILKTISCERAYHWINGEKAWKKEYTAMF